MTMPKFNFSNATFKSEAALQEATGKKGGGKVMQPGKHEVTIAAAEFRGMSEKDPSWAKVSITLQGTGEKKVMDMLLVPTADIVYGANKTLFPYKKLQNFLGALGYTLTVENLGEVLGSTLSRPEQLIGKNLAVEVGYGSRSHIRVIRNDLREQVGVRIVDGRTKSDMVDGSGNPLSFSDVDSATAYLDTNNIPYESFPSVQSYIGSSTPNGSGKKDANW